MVERVGGPIPRQYDSASMARAWTPRKPTANFWPPSVAGEETDAGETARSSVLDESSASSSFFLSSPSSSSSVKLGLSSEIRPDLRLAALARERRLLYALDLSAGGEAMVEG